MITIEMKHWIYLLCLICLTGSASAQGAHPYIKNFSAKSYGQRILVSWTTKAGFSCQDIDVQLSTDSTTFETKATYFGLCGDTSERDYSLTIDSPFLNSLNYVRLDLGTYGISYVISVQVLAVESVLIYPLPITNESVLILEEERTVPLKLVLFDVQGQLILETEWIEAALPIGKMIQHKGVYFYRILEDRRLISSGKVLR